MAKKKAQEKKSDDRVKETVKRPIKDLFQRIYMKIGTLEFGLGFSDKVKEMTQVANSVTQDLKDLEVLLIYSGLYDDNYICANCFIKKHNLAKGIYLIPEYLKVKNKKCTYCGKTQVCRIDLEVK